LTPLRRLNNFSARAGELEQLLVLQDRQQKIRQIENEIKNLPLQRKHLELQLAESAASLELSSRKRDKSKSNAKGWSSMSARVTKVSHA